MIGLFNMHCPEYFDKYERRNNRIKSVFESYINDAAGWARI